MSNIISVYTASYLNVLDLLWNSTDGHSRKHKYKHTVCTYIDALYICCMNIHRAHTVQCSDAACGFQLSSLTSPHSVLSLCEHKEHHILIWDVGFPNFINADQTNKWWSFAAASGQRISLSPSSVSPIVTEFSFTSSITVLTAFTCYRDHGGFYIIHIFYLNSTSMVF